MIQVRPITSADTEAYFNLISANRQRLSNYFPVTLSKTETLEKTRECVDSYLELTTTKELFVFLIMYGEQPIGVVILKEIDHRSQKCEFAWFIDGAYEGRGHASQALQPVMTFVFNELEFNRVFCMISVGNAPSIRLAERNGFEHEGILKENFKMSDGSFSDVHHYGLLKSKWKIVKRL